MLNPIIPNLDIPVRTIFCIGRNYAKHAAEMGANVPGSPVVFLKPLSSVCFENDSVAIPDFSTNVHYEGEIVVAIGREGFNIPPTDAKKYIAGIGCGIDFTARDLQQEAKQKGLPWSVCKGFENFAPISNFLSFDDHQLDSIELSLTVNGTKMQSGNSMDMIFPIPSLISYLSSITRLYPGDLIFTGTPEGVGQVEVGDVVSVSLPNLDCTLSVRITS